jgi:acetyl/propionyl-CoA carboxylase alpha subunit
MSERLFRHRDEEIAIEVERDGNLLVLRRGDADSCRFEARRVGTAEYVLADPEDDGAMHTLFALRDGDRYWIHLDGRTWLLERQRRRSGGQAAPGSLMAPTPGTVDEVLVAEGDPVEEAQVLVVLTSMKMQIEIKAPHAGTVTSLSLKPGDQVDGGVPLLQIEATED